METALREKGFDLADVETDEIERRAVEGVANNPDITKEAERRVDRRSGLVGQLTV